MRLRFAPGILTMAACSYAQLATTTSLVGTITDTSGKVIPNVTITAVETATQDKHTAVTNEQGYYAIDFVRVGAYNITAETQRLPKSH